MAAQMSSIKRENLYWLDNGTVLAGRYRIDGVIEEGGFGIVYLGWDELLQAKVSVKEFFPRELAKREGDAQDILVYQGKSEQIFEKGLEKFLNEARMLAAFNHSEGVVWVQDFFYENNTAYIIMQYVDGINIKEYVKEHGVMDVGQVLEIMKPILHSLGQIHKLGLIHRDISPDNIVVDKEGTAYLVDFGIARPYVGSDLKTITVFFKRGYAAEEQYREKGEQGPWTDIYSVCATMYYMLTGVQPVESVQRNIKDTLVPLAAYQRFVIPEYVQKAIKKGMAVEAAKRYRMVGQLYQALYGEGQDGQKGRRKALIWWAAGVGVFFLALFLYRGRFGDDKNTLPANLLQQQLVSIETEKIINTSVALGIYGPMSDSKQDVSSEKEESAGKQGLENEKQYTIPAMQGKTEKKARKLYKKIGDTSLKLTIKRKYHTKVAKGRVVKQSVRAGFQYQKGDIGEIILTVSKGKREVKPKSTDSSPQVPITAPPAATRRPVITEAPKKPTKKDDGFVGTLPY